MAASKKRAQGNGSKLRREKEPVAKADRFDDLAAQLAEIGRRFYERGWLFGTSGNLSAVVNQQPLRLAITPTGLDKGALAPGQFLEIDDAARIIRGKGRPSAETGLHLAIIRARGAGAVLHTHSLWTTILSEKFAAEGAVAIDGFEMLKGLHGIQTHQHKELLPVFENDQDIARLAARVEAVLEREHSVHGFLLRRHGLYTWGRDLAEAKRHVEVLEFLLEAVGKLPGTV